MKNHQKKTSSTFKFGKLRFVLIFLPACILFFLSSFLFVGAILVQRNIVKYHLFPNPFPSYRVGEYPIYGAKDTATFPSFFAVLPSILTAQSAIVLDADSQVVLFSKNPLQKMSMASTTKIMTALVALDYYELLDVLTVKSSNVSGAIAGLFPGEKLTFHSLLYTMLLPSANDAAVTIADNYPGGREMFVQKMNEKARELYLTQTHFADPTGLDDQGDITSVSDLARLAAFAIRNPLFATIVSTKEKVVADTNGKALTLQNLNRLLGEYGVTGVKTGFTQEAGGVLVTSKNESGHTIIIIVMKSDDRFKDTEVLLNTFSGNITYVPMYQ